MKWQGYNSQKMLWEAQHQKMLHREEHLEAEIRRLRQCLRNLSDAVLAGSDIDMSYAQEIKDLLEEV